MAIRHAPHCEKLHRIAESVHLGQSQVVSVDINGDNTKPAVRCAFDFRSGYGHKYPPSLVVTQEPVADGLPVVLARGEVPANSRHDSFMPVLKPDVVEGQVFAFFRQCIGQPKSKRNTAVPGNGCYTALTPGSFILTAQHKELAIAFILPVG